MIGFLGVEAGMMLLLAVIAIESAPSFSRSPAARRLVILRSCTFLRPGG